MKNYSPETIFKNKFDFIYQTISWSKLIAFVIIWIILTTYLYSSRSFNLNSIEVWAWAVIICPVIFILLYIYSLSFGFKKETVLDLEEGLLLVGEKKMLISSIRTIIYYSGIRKFVFSVGFSSIPIYLKNDVEGEELYKIFLNDKRFHGQIRKINF